MVLQSLGMPFLHQHQVAIVFNPSRTIVRSGEPLEMEGPEITTITPAAVEVPGEMNVFADALSWVYSDRRRGVTRTQNERIQDIDDEALIEIMSTEIRWSTRLDDKPEVDYEGTRSRTPKVEEENNSPMAIQGPSVKHGAITVGTRRYPRGCLSILLMNGSGRMLQYHTQRSPK